MNFELILRIISVCTVSAILTLGILILAGTILPAAIPEKFSVMMGSLMVLYGVYRLWMLWMKRPKAQHDNDESL